MKRLKLSHNYHDAILNAVEIGHRTLTLVVDLHPPSNNRVPERRHLVFAGVRNLDEVREVLGLEAEQTDADVGAEIIGIARADDGRILVDVMKLGALYIDCASMTEI